MIDEIKNAISLTQAGKYSEAEDIYLKLLKENSDNSILLSAVGLFYINLGDFDKACEYLKKSCDIKKSIGTLSALGFAEYDRENYYGAAEALEQALEYGENQDIYDRLISSLFNIRKTSKAIKFAEIMYEKYPDSVRAITNKIKALTQSGKLIEAEKLCTETLKKDMNAPALWFQLGFLKELIYSDDNNAKECYKAAAQFGAPNAEYNIAVCAQKLGDYEEAEKNYKKMLEKFPNSMETKVSLGMCYLLQKRFKEGYELFYNRSYHLLLETSNNPWKPGQKIADEVVIICDQGYGDHIQFIRYLPFLEGKKVKIAARKQLKNLFKLNYPEMEFIDYSEINPNTQAIRITDLAYALDMDFEHIPFSEGYLNIEKADIQSQRPKIGLCWEAGSAAIRNMINRTMNVKCFERFFDMDEIQLYSLQYEDSMDGNSKYPQMINLAQDFKDFSDTAQAIKAMDAVITVDTAVAHLSGALGVKTYLLLPYAADWRWFDDTDTTPWYKSVKIFKQVEHISWEKPLDDLYNEIKNQFIL